MNRFSTQNQPTNPFQVLSDVYRYGFNGMERGGETPPRRDEHYTTHFRQYDPGLCIWLSIDPKFSELPWQTPYCSMDGDPIKNNDPLGDKIIVRGSFGFTLATTGRLLVIRILGSKEIRQKVRELNQSDNLLKISNKKGDVVGQYVPVASIRDKKSGLIRLNNDEGKKAVVPGAESGTLIRPKPTATLVNELSHAHDDLIRGGQTSGETTNDLGEVVPNYEIESNKLENQWRKRIGQALRREDSHAGTLFPSNATARMAVRISRMKEGNRRDKRMEHLEKRIESETKK